HIPMALSRKLEQWTEGGTTLYMVLLAVLNLLLYRYAGQEDIIVGSPAAGREHADLQDIIGMFIKTLTMRNFPSGDKPFAAFLEEVKENTLQVYEHQAYPFGRLMKQVAGAVDLSRNPLFDVMLIVQNFRAAEAATADSSVSQDGEADALLETAVASLGLGQVGSKVDFTIELDAILRENGFHFHIEYCTALFKKETVQRLAAHFIHILKEAADNPALPLAQFQVMDETEKQKIMETF
ncbi:MAG: hypothetical protein GY765_17650, partial [bacterium]|nr:hypothetical protein [bacterium]